MNKYLSRFFATSGLVVLASCGGDDGPNYADEIDEENMGLAAEISYSFMGDVIEGFLNGNPGAQLPLAPPAPGASIADRLLADVVRKGFVRAGRPELAASHGPHLVSTVCTPTETGVDEFGDAIDSDDDGIPNDYTLTFPAGCTETTGDYTDTFSGSLRIRDQAGLYAYRLDLNNLKVKEVNNVSGEVFSFTSNGTESAVYAASGATHSAHLTYAIFQQYDDAVVTASLTGPQPSSTIQTFNVGLTWNEETSFDPDGTIALEAPIPSGDIDIDLDFRLVASGGGESLAFRFQLTTPTVLHYDTSSCSGINSGVVRGALNSSADIYFLITFTGCGTTTFETHGTTAATVASR